MLIFKLYCQKLKPRREKVSLVRHHEGCSNCCYRTTIKSQVLVHPGTQWHWSWILCSAQWHHTYTPIILLAADIKLRIFHPNSPHIQTLEKAKVVSLFYDDTSQNCPDKTQQPFMCFLLLNLDVSVFRLAMRWWDNNLTFLWWLLFTLRAVAMDRIDQRCSKCFGKAQWNGSVKIVHTVIRRSHRIA